MGAVSYTHLDVYKRQVIGLIAFDQVQKTKLLSSRDELIQFIEKMADLISGNIRAEIKMCIRDRDERWRRA